MVFAEFCEEYYKGCCSEWIIFSSHILLLGSIKSSAVIFIIKIYEKAIKVGGQG